MTWPTIDEALRRTDCDGMRALLKRMLWYYERGRMPPPRYYVSRERFSRLWAEAVALVGGPVSFDEFKILGVLVRPQPEHRNWYWCEAI